MLSAAGRGGRSAAGAATRFRTAIVGTQQTRAYRLWRGSSSEDEEPQDGTSHDGKSSLTLHVNRKTEDMVRRVLGPLNEQFNGPLETNMARTPLPFVFLLGNHSSGKSSFINHVLERRVQNTGVAPTDDGFTIIVPGSEDMDQDGPTLVGSPDMGFSGLRTFGPNLIHHTHLKIRSDLRINDLMLVDSPGMIDSPADSISYITDKSRSDRGYDFEGVTRWFAERADVILLFFDPDKPGTTGETLSVLTNSLAGMDHKLHIVLNKVDQFKKIHDFARAYGSLCWNLSKVIPRKDLPRIYTMYTPVTTDKGNAGRSFKFQDQHREQVEFNTVNPELSWKSSLQDLEATRQDVIDEVLRAPDRRIDNMITHLYDSGRLLRMHMEMVELIRAEYQSEKRKSVLTSIGVGVGGNLVSLAAIYLAPGIWGFSLTLSASSLAGAAGVYLYGNHLLQRKAARMTDDAYLDDLFRRVFVKELADRDQFVESLWIRVRPHVKSALQTLGIANLPRVSARGLQAIDDIVENQVPALRREAQPAIAARR
ncbi:EH-domain containing protein, putative [Hondaea fermentalgiana]|uniref:EH-domain containing protein, putative n=1 Tax=Hondaea fermentalgiana TaxID=2315210 RepID=A0A2R5G0U3_9STRA|nr:EH-domain containing protein, putative [Hondaea fermentalgiana]|eukprot:GBG23909.1 EH-domain containing protein, putative [Hondaea fermentalgiana]